MAVPGKNSLSVFKNGSCSAVLGLVFAMMFTLAVTVTAAQAQSFQVIHNFTGLGDGSEPNYGLTRGFRRKYLPEPPSPVTPLQVRSTSWPSEDRVGC